MQGFQGTFEQRDDSGIEGCPVTVRTAIQILEWCAVRKRETHFELYLESGEASVLWF